MKKRIRLKKIEMTGLCVGLLDSIFCPEKDKKKKKIPKIYPT